MSHLVLSRCTYLCARQTVGSSLSLQFWPASKYSFLSKVPEQDFLDFRNWHFRQVFGYFVAYQLAQILIHLLAYRAQERWRRDNNKSADRCALVSVGQGGNEVLREGIGKLYLRVSGFQCAARSAGDRGRAPIEPAARPTAIINGIVLGWRPEMRVNL